MERDVQEIDTGSYSITALEVRVGRRVPGDAKAVDVEEGVAGMHVVFVRGGVVVREELVEC